jgi:methylamine dehydrogenase accessory protein MauD
VNEALLVSTIVLWVVVLALLVVVFALARQVGILYERIAPMGALMLDHGPKPGEAAPQLALTALDGSALAVGAPGAQSQLLFFLSPTCPVCKKLLPILKSIARDESKWLRLVFASDGEVAEHRAFVGRAALQDYPYVLSTELGMAFKVGKLPYAVLIDEHGTVRAKGLVNSREQLESLFTAKDLAVGSVQGYLQTQTQRS